MSYSIRSNVSILPSILLLAVAFQLAGPSAVLCQSPGEAGKRPGEAGKSPGEARIPGAVSDLTVVLDTGVVLQDRNEDGVVDDLSLSILLPPEPSEAELAAAANLAARFGFETSASNLGLLGAADSRKVYSTPVVLVGLRAMRLAGASQPPGSLSGELAPGQGMVIHLPPGGAFRMGGVGLAGYDASGLLEASAYLSGRYPEVWEPDGESWSELVESVRSFLQGLGTPDPSLALDRIVVERGRPGITRARVRVRLPDLAAYDSTLEALLRPDTAWGPLEEADTAWTPSRESDPGSDPTPGTSEPDAPVTDAPEPDPPVAGRQGSRRDLEFRSVHRLDLLVTGPDRSRTLTYRPDEAWDFPSPRPLRPAGAGAFSLPDVYAVGGVYRDTNQDLVPDDMRGFISLKGSAAPEQVVDLATRLGLETAGVRLPLVTIGAEENDPSSSGLPIFLGTDHYQIRRLREEGALSGPEVEAGQGFVQVVDEAFGESPALAVGGGDGSGLSAAVRWLARRAPYLWNHGKGEYTLTDAEREVRRFLQGRRGPGQVALALTKLETWMDRMAEDPPSRMEVELSAEEAPEELVPLVTAMVNRRFPETRVTVKSWPTGFGVGDTIFVHEWDIPWEVDEVRELLDTQVYREVQSGEAVAIEIRVSEPPQIREALAREIEAELSRRGVVDATIHVLSAYKQGYSWIHDVLLPRLRGLPVATVDLTYHTLEESEEVRWQTIAAETRWLQEVYPIDAVLSRELGIPDSAVTFHPTRGKNPVYTFEARDMQGDLLLQESFDPRYVIRPFFDLFPEYEQVRVTTGWIRASSGNDLLLDRRVATDPERFWDRLQTETFQEIIEYVMDIQDGDPSGNNAPFFDEFRVDLRLSEPDYRIGVDEETISSLEALHEDIFFETHTLFTLLGGRYQTSLSNPGRVLPFVDPSGVGEPGKARLVLTGKERAGPKLAVRSWSRGESEPVLREYELDPLPVEESRVVGVTVESGEDGLGQLMARVTVPDSADRFPEFAARTSESRIDREFLSVELLEGMVDNLRRLHEVGLMEETLSWDRVRELVLDFRLEEDSTYRRSLVLPRSRNPRSTDNPRLSAPGWTYGGETLVQWETPISVEENEKILSRLGTFPGVDVYYLTDSYLGHRVWAADFLPPQAARYVSQAKLNALKPTLFVSGREHANEVSSTSHILRLGELLVTDSAYREMLRKVNVVLHALANPDGAALAYARQLVNPDHMLHAGRPGALGRDATSGGGEDPVYPESRAREMIREAWLPDIYLNPHGYPSHEWVQYFAGYSAWARGRRVGPRTWWVPRGWFIPGFSWVDDEDHPEYREAQFAILDSMAAAITGHPEVDAMNRRLYARYKKYGEQDRDGFTEFFYNGMVVNMSLRGAEGIGTGLTSPRITYFSATTEAPDETARGDWLTLMGEAGLAHTTAALRYLAGGEFEVKRESEIHGDFVVRKVFRVKPVLPPGDEVEEGQGGEGEG